MKNIITALALTFAAILTAPAQSIYLSVDGPAGPVRPGDSFQLTYTVTWDEGFFTEDYRFIGIGIANVQWPEYLNRFMMLESVESHLPTDFELHASTGYMNQIETGFMLSNFHDGGGVLTPPLLVATVTYQTYPIMDERSYLIPLNMNQFKTYYATSDYEMHAFDPENVKFYTLNVSSVPEPSTYAAGIGIVALIATAVIRRRNKRS